MRARPSHWVAAVGCLLAGGCGGQAAAPDPVFTDGTRLKAIWEQAPGAPKRLTGWYDTVLETPCAFTYATDAFNHAPGERQYCVPSRAASLVTNGLGVLFADADCSQPIAEASCEQRFVLGPVGGSDCTPDLQLFWIGSAVVPDSTYIGGTASCIKNGPQQPGSAPAWHALGDPIRLEMLVSATLAVPTGGGARIQPVQLRASDGASAQVAAWDTQRGEQVAVPDWGFQYPAIEKWEPVSPAANTGTQPFYSDEACTAWLATSGSCGDVGVKSITLWGTPTCHGNREQTHYEVAGEIDLSSAYVFANPSCFPATEADVPYPGTVRFFEPGALIPARAFADARVVEQGHGRIRMRQPASDDGAVDTGAGQYLDTTLGQACAPGLAADGSLRCLPLDGSAFPNLYADAACTVPLASFPRPTGCGSNAPGAAASFLLSLPYTCGEMPRYRTYAVGAPHTGSIYLLEKGGGCYETDAASLFAIYDLGPEMAPDAFEAMTVSAHYPP